VSVEEIFFHSRFSGAVQYAPGCAADRQGFFHFPLGVGFRALSQERWPISLFALISSPSFPPFLVSLAKRPPYALTLEEFAPPPRELSIVFFS